MSDHVSHNLEYIRRVYGNVEDWYKNADAKAQVIFTLDGAFLTFLTNSIFNKDLDTLLNRIGWITGCLLTAMVICLAASIISAIICLWSRIHSEGELDRLLNDVQPTTTYYSSVSWFFQMIARFDEARFKETLKTMPEDFEMEALAANIIRLSARVSRKHLWVNRGFVLGGAALVLFLLSSLAYVARL